MIIRRLILLVSLVSSLASAAPCERRLADIRKHLLASSLEDRGRREMSWISSLSDESPEVGLDILVRTAPADHVISLGSGPDLFRPLYVFAPAEHLHMVDIGTGWSGGLTAIFAEIEQRLGHLGRDAMVERLRDGFLRYRPAPKFTGSVLHGGERHEVGPWRLKGGKWHFYTKPCVWRVTWTAADGRAQRRFVYLHVGDFTDDAFVRSVIQSTRGRLKGLFITGVGLPRRPALDMYLAALQPGGLFYAGLEYGLAQGKPHKPERGERAANRYLRKNLAVLQRIPTPIERIEAEPRLFWPTYYLFEKKFAGARP